MHCLYGHQQMNILKNGKGITSTTKLKDNGQDQTQDKSQQIQMALIIGQLMIAKQE